MKRRILINLLILLSIQTLAAAGIRLVPQVYDNIQDAIDASGTGDIIIVGEGVYTGSGNVNLDFGGKAITVQSAINPLNPNPDVIANTIIDCQGDVDNDNRAFHFESGEGNDSKVIGFTIRNGYSRGAKGSDGPSDYDGTPYSGTSGLYFIPYSDSNPDYCEELTCPPRARWGFDANDNGYGGAILCDNASSPTIQHCVITDCTVTGAHGGQGADGQDGIWFHYTIADFNFLESPPVPLPGSTPTENSDGQWGGRGGNGIGNGYGGAIACLGNSNPIIIDCNISNNTARGGCGGPGGNGGVADGIPPDYDGEESFGGDAGVGFGDGVGGAIYAENSSPVITNCIFRNNVAATGARIEGGSRGEGTEITFENGGPATDGDDSPVVSSRYYLTKTDGIAGGAAYFMNSSTANFTNCTFIDNKAYEAYVFPPPYGAEDIAMYAVGGAIDCNANNVVSLNNCDFTDNLGGAVYCASGCTLDLDGCSFTGNSDPHDGTDGQYGGMGVDYASGGALYIGDSGSADINNCSFSGNLAKNDGGAVKCKSDAVFTNCSFGSNLLEYSGEDYGYGGAVDAQQPGTTLNLDFNDCSFTGNQGVYGGGFATEDADVNFTDCYFLYNTAQRGGGLDLVDANLLITGGVIKGNNATYGDGGGLLCSVTKTEIRNCVISDNSAEGVYPITGSGGAINFYGGVFGEIQLLSNCLITGNSAVVDGGGVSCEFLAYPEIRNCTFSDNSADGYGGAIFSDFISEPNITDCIIKGCNNHAIHEEDYGGNAIAQHCLFYNNPDGDYYDSGTELVYTGSGEVGSIPGGFANMYANPLFVTGPLGSFYLSQIAAGQGSNSPAVNSGSDTAANLGLDTFTTRTDNGLDSGQVDRGYHYPDSTGMATYQLTAGVTGGNGTVSPTSGSFPEGAVVTLTATPSPGWRVKEWSGTGNDASTDTINTVIMNSDRTVGVEFEQPKTLVVTVGGGGEGFYSNISSALHDAEDGDTIVVYPGIYNGVATFVSKDVEIRSLNPDDPGWVAQTIIDSTGHAGPVFEIGRNTYQIVPVGPNCVLNGFTIRNSRWYTDTGEDGFEAGQNGEDGPPGAGGAIYIFPGSGPTIKNCVIRDNYVLGGFGGTGSNADDTHNAGRGGWGGYARGGAVYCGMNSYPKFINCRIIDNQAIGGTGGTGGAWDETGGSANYGGNWSMAEWYDRLTNSTAWVYVEGDLWEVWYTTIIAGEMYIVSDPYIGDYRWYSGYGGGVFIDEGSNIEFVDCTISGNLAQGGLSGLGGEEPGSDIWRAQPWPLQYEIPSFGGGVYCAADSNVAFVGCTISDNIASDPQFDHVEFVDGIDVEENLTNWIQPEYDPDNTHSIDPYLGHGGGVCAEDTARVVFTDCTLSGNMADAGGGLHSSNTGLMITDCNFTSNSAFQGGGVFGQNGPVTIHRSVFTYNVSSSSDGNDPNVLGQGGGMHFWSVDTDITDCNISGNQADASGGGAFFGGESTPFMNNCLLTNNTAGGYGGGVSTHTYSSLMVSNCTVAENEVTGIGFETGYGGGIYCSYESYVNIIDSIIWGNVGPFGPQLAIKTSFQSSAMDVSYSDVQNGQSYVFVDTGSVLNWGAGNLNADPCFATGPLGDYYLGRTITGQPADSPCVDAGSDSADNLGMHLYTTRTDEQPDRDIVDMGYHYPIAPEEELCRFCELFRDGVINFKDFALFALNWLDEGCALANEWCQHADVTLDGYVDSEDVDLFAQCWLVEDIYAPVPNPSQWLIPPHSSLDSDSIFMAAEPADDAWDYWVGNVQYYFECVTTGGNDSGWQDEPNYLDTGLVIGNEYGYKVRARDASEQIPAGDTESGNKTDWSPIRYAIVGQGAPAVEDHDPPTPNPMTWAVVPNATSSTSISMTADTATDTCSPPVEYYFECTTDAGASSDWQSGETYTAISLDPETEYTFRVKARDTSAWFNETGWSTEESATTPAAPPPPDTDPPTPDPSQWAAGGEPQQYYAGGWWHTMTAEPATDATGPVEYYFELVTGDAGTQSSGWQTSNVYTYQVSFSGSKFGVYKVRTRDAVTPTPNVSGWSTSLPAN